MHIDMDAMRRARHEVRGEHFTLTVGGENFNLPTELPLEVGEIMESASSDMMPVMKVLVGENDWTRFMAVRPRPTNEDVVELLALYGKQLGEFAASVFSSASNGTQSRPTSPASTEPTSPSSAGADAAPPPAA